ncbi:MAG TPA: S8 family serine peptidase, partial [Nitrososphaeraceae archaeon]|nr:S8 family serine peptidase [Nitrososphaeraceae archaeon]
MRRFVNNNFINFPFIPLIFIILTFLQVSSLVVFAEETIATIPVGDSPEIQNNYNNIENNLQNNSIISNDSKSINSQQTSSTTSAFPSSTSSIEFSMFSVLPNNLNFSNSNENIKDSSENLSHESLFFDSKKNNFQFKGTIPSFVGNNILSNNITKNNLVNALVNDLSGEVTRVSSITLEDCDDCFLSTNDGGEVPEGLLKKLNKFLAENPVTVGETTDTVGNVEGLCKLIVENGGISLEQITKILNDAFPGESNDPAIQGIIECIANESIIPIVDTILNLPAEDGNGNPVNQGESTSSTGITFDYSGTSSSDAFDIVGFECRLDSNDIGDWEECNPLEPFENPDTKVYLPGSFSVGHHTFDVRAYINFGEGPNIYDPEPPRFEWDVIPDTVIESAVDGEDNDLIDDDDPTTTSDSMTFTFVAELDNEPATSEDDIGFVCSLDGEIQDCSSGTFFGTIDYDDLPTGPHTFLVAAYIIDGDIDPTPAIFTWTIVEEDDDDNNPPDDDNNPPDDDNNPSSNNNNPSSPGGSTNVPNEAGGNPNSGGTSPGNAPAGAFPISPITPTAIDPSIPRDITIYQQQYRNAGPINAKYGTQVGNQCILELNNNQTIISENVTQAKANITNAILQQSGQSIEILDLMTIGNTTIATINDCDANVLGNVTTTSPIATEGQFDLYGEIASIAVKDLSNQTKGNKENSNTTTIFNKADKSNTTNNNNSKIGNNLRITTNKTDLSNANTIPTNMKNNESNNSISVTNTKLNITWNQGLPISLSDFTNDTLKNILQNMSDQKINSTLTKETLYNVTFYQFMPLDITRTLLNLTNATLLENGNKILAHQLVNETSRNNTSTANSNITKLSPTSSTEPIDIVIVDTGVSQVHPDLTVYRSLSFVNGTIRIDPESTEDRNGHGSHIAGVINAKDNGYGIVGIAPQDNIRIWSLKVCSDDGVCAISDQLKAIEYITLNADMFDLVNYSIENPYSKLFEKAISESVKAGVPYVVAAGNFAKNATLTTSPASNPDVITVSAIGDSDGKCGGLGPLLDMGRIPDDTFADFSNFGPSIDIAAPGVDIISTYNGTNYGILSGTSMAVPHVTGLAALLKMQNPNASPEELKELIIKSGSSPTSECLENKGIGYFTHDFDDIHEPLLVLPKRMISTETLNLFTDNNISNQTEILKVVNSEQIPANEKTTTKEKGGITEESNKTKSLRDDSKIGVDVITNNNNNNNKNDTKTNSTKQELPTAKVLTTAKPNVTKQEIPTAKPTIEPAKPTATKANVTKQELPITKPTIEPAKPTATKPNVTKQELPTTKPTTKKQQQPSIVENQTNIPTQLLNNMTNVKDDNIMNLALENLVV